MLKRFLIISLCLIPAMCWSAAYNSDLERWTQYYGSREKAQALIELNQRAKKTSPNPNQTDTGLRKEPSTGAKVIFFTILIVGVTGLTFGYTYYRKTANNYNL